MQFFCDVTYDPFVYMQENDKVYSERRTAMMYRPQHTDGFSGFTISLVEWEPTIPTLWSTVKGENVCATPGYDCYLMQAEFVKRYPEYLSQNNSLGFLSDNDGVGYNLCHCKSQIMHLIGYFQLIITHFSLEQF